MQVRLKITVFRNNVSGKVEEIVDWFGWNRKGDEEGMNGRKSGDYMKEKENVDNCGLRKKDRMARMEENKIFIKF